MGPAKAPMAVAVSEASCLTSMEALFYMIWLGTEPLLKVPSLDILDPFFTTTFFSLLQNYSQRDATASSPKYATSSAVAIAPSKTVTKGASWGISGAEIGIVIWGMVLEGVEV